MIHTVLFVCLTVETADQNKKNERFFVVLFLADKCVCNGCQRFLENHNCVHHRGLGFEDPGAPHLKEP